LHITVNAVQSKTNENVQKFTYTKYLQKKQKDPKQTISNRNSYN